MFSNYDDSYDNIDNYYEEVYSIFPDQVDILKTSQSTNKDSSSVTGTAAAPATAPSTIIPTNIQSLTNTLTPTTKQNFEVYPNQVIDGHPIGSQPKYNLLYSKPQDNFEGMRNKLAIAISDNLLISIMFLILILFIAHLSNKISRMNYIVHHLLWEKKINTMMKNSDST